MKKSKKIKNGIKSCLKTECYKCPYFSNGYHCINSLYKDTLKYIKKLERK